MQQFGETFKAYASNQKVALTVQQTETQADKSPTVTFEIADFIDGVANWDSKVVIQLTRYELTALTRVLLNWNREVAGQFHGEGRNRSFKVIGNDDGSLFIGVNNAGTKKRIILMAEERVELFQLTVRQQAKAWQMSVTDTLSTLKATHGIVNGVTT